MNMENKVDYKDEQLQRVVMNTLTEIFKQNTSTTLADGSILNPDDEGYKEFLVMVSDCVNHLKENI
jgi:hypothetical protein